jgi:hypothetical protein
MSSEAVTILTAGIAAAAGLLGTGIGALITYLTMRKQVEVSMQAIKSQADIAKAERASRFALAALEKRLDVHQKAYRLWTNLYWNWHKANVSDIALQCQEFWYDNCLYLDPVSRSSFKKILFHAGTFQSYDDAMKAKVFSQLEDVGRHLTEGVDLHFMQHKLETTRIEDVQQGRAADVLKAAADA